MSCTQLWRGPIQQSVYKLVKHLRRFLVDNEITSVCALLNLVERPSALTAFWKSTKKEFLTSAAARQKESFKGNEFQKRWLHSGNSHAAPLSLASLTKSRSRGRFAFRFLHLNVAKRFRTNTIHTSRLSCCCVLWKQEWVAFYVRSLQPK